VQPQYGICWSSEFIADVKKIVGLELFERAFAGYDYNLARLPRGQGTWDLSPMGDYRLGHIPAHRLENGADIPAIYFTFRLQLDPEPLLVLLRARRSNDPEFS
jgi:hypothetical protein